MSCTPLPPGGTIGIIGGGQLGRMSAMAASRLGYRTHILTSSPDSPAAQVSNGVTIGSTDDAEAMSRFADHVDVVTFEFENLNAAGLDALARRRPIYPSPASLRLTQDRISEKSFINAVGASTGPWMPVASFGDLRTAVDQLGFPAVLKTTTLGYDGRGQAILRAPEDLQPAFARLAPMPFVLETLIDFACEISVIVARGLDGTVVAFDAVENRHRNHILDLTLAPAQVTPKILAKARDVATDLARSLGIVGLIAVEMFVDRNGAVLVNELAPRPHNSGHWTIDACPVSQFEMHIRAVAGLPLLPATRHSDAVMKNLVGPEELALWPEILRTPGLIPHLYGKTDAPPGRKMGHVTRLFPKGSLPGPFGIAAALAVFKARP